MSDKNDVKKDIAYFEMQGELPSEPIEWFLAALHERYLKSCERR